MLFQSALHQATDLVWEEIPDALDWSEPTWWYVVLVTGLAGVLVAAALRLPGTVVTPRSKGSGWERPCFIEPWSDPARRVSDACARFVLGPEAPLIALGLGLGSVACA